MTMKTANCGASMKATQASTPKMMAGGMAMKKKPMAYGHGGMAKKKTGMMYGGMAHKKKK